MFLVVSAGISGSLMVFVFVGSVISKIDAEKENKIIEKIINEQIKIQLDIKENDGNL